MNKGNKGLLIGSHVGKNSFMNDIKEYDLETIQLFIGSPRSWKSPTLSDDQVVNLKNVSKKMPVFVHAPYLYNPASANPEVREKTLYGIQHHLDLLSQFDSSGLIVHAGQGGQNSDIETSLKRWEELANKLNITAPLLIENTAGGLSAPGRDIKSFSKLLRTFKNEEKVGYCIDTNHAWNGNFGLDDLYKKLMDEIGFKPNLIHLNGSLDELGSGRDRHSNLGNDEVTVLSLNFIEQVGGPVVLETPGKGFINDLKILRDRFSSS